MTTTPPPDATPAPAPDAARDASPDAGRLVALANRLARVGGWVIELPGRAVRWSREVARIHDWPLDERAVYGDLMRLYVPDAQRQLTEALARCERDGTPFDVQAELHTRAGRHAWVRVIGEAVRDTEGRVVALQGAVQDITEQHRMEQELARAAERLSTTLESISDAFFTVDEAWRFTYVNQQAAQLLKHPREALLGVVLWERFPEAVGTPFHAQYTRAMRDRCEVEFEAYYAPYENWFAVKAYPVPDGLAVYFRDATAAHHAGQQLRLLQSSVERINDVVVITDAEPITGRGPRIVYVNDAFERITGYRRDEVIGRTPRILQGPRTDRRTLDRIRHALETWQPVRAEVLNYTKSGEEIWFEIDIVPLADETGWYTNWVAVERDVTERRRLEQQILRAQRLESIGTLAGGIAHDLNNVLSPILMSVGLLRERATDADMLRRLDVIDQAASRGASMIRQVLGFARGLEGERQVLHVAPVVDELLRIVGETFPRDVTLSATVKEGCWPVEADPTQLQQVLLNLCVNARDAMPEGGRLTIRAEPVPLDVDRTAGLLEAPAGPWVRLTVEDTGSGIAPDHLDKVFDPFFTTKPPGQGTGLGLSTTLAIVRGHRGFVRLESTPGSGTRVEVYLPAASAESDAGPAPTIAEVPRGEGETVLVVDDEGPIRAMTRDALEAHGYRVLEAPDGAEAIAIYAEHADSIAVVVTDLMMPVMDGAATIQLLHRLAPRVRVIAVSGLSTSREARHALSLGASAFLAKPYTAPALLGTIARVLGRA